MKPAPFDYCAPETMEEALDVLRQYGQGARVLAGGQSLMPLLNMRLVRPQVVMDINRIPGLDFVRSCEGQLHVGAMVRHRTVETSDVLNRACPLLTAAAREMGDVQVRNRGTFGGSIAHANPAAQLCAVVYTLGGQIVARGPRGPRVIPADEFFLGPLTTALAPDELVVEVRVPVLGSSAWSFRSLAPRHSDFPIAGVVVVIDADASGVCSGARLGMFGVGPTPLRARRAERHVVGSRLEDNRIREVAAMASREAEPRSDLNASADYRRQMIKYLMEWALADARSKISA